MGHVDDYDGVPACPGGAVSSGRGMGRCGFRVIVGMGRNSWRRAVTVSRIAHLPRRRSRRPMDPHSADTTVRRAHRRRCMHARTHAHTHVTKRDEELRMRTAEKCNTESSGTACCHTPLAHTLTEPTTTIARTTTITLRRYFSRQLSGG